MPAVIRGAGKGRSVTRKAAARGGGSSKLEGAGAAGLHPRAALYGGLVLILILSVLLLVTGGRLHRLAGELFAAADQKLAAAGFKVRTVTVEGGSALSSADVLRAAGLAPGAPIFGVNLEDVRERVEGVGWIKSAKVIRLLPDAIVLVVRERPRLAVWQHGSETRVVDRDGQIIPEADPARFADLPLIVGEGANEGAAQILPEIAARPGLFSRVEALVRVDGRRWDLKMKDGGLIQLPASREDSALIQFDQLEQSAHLLEAGFERVDLRDPEMVAVRPRGAAADTPPAAGDGRLGL